MSKNVLGRGLDALISQNTIAFGMGATDQVYMVPLERIVPNPRQPRQQVDETRLEELSRSIQEKGVLEPLILRPLDDGNYELVAGERRLRAAQRAGHKEVPALLRSFEGRESLEVALIENLQREDLNPVDEARAYQRLAEEFGRTHGEISQEVGKDRSTVTNLLRLLRLAPEVLEEVSRGTLSVGHARVLLSVDDPKEQIRLARAMIQDGWSVRQAERQVSTGRQQKSKAEARDTSRPESRDPEVLRVEEALRYTLGTEVHLSHGPVGGRIEIRYGSSEELERILELLGIQVH